MSAVSNSGGSASGPASRLRVALSAENIYNVLGLEIDFDEISEASLDELSFATYICAAQEAAYIPWFDKLSGVVAAAGPSQGDVDSRAASAADADEYRGWKYAASMDAESARADVMSTIFVPPPPTPVHWGEVEFSSLHRDNSVDTEIFGNLDTWEGALTRLAIAECAPDEVLKRTMTLLTDPDGRRRYGSVVPPAVACAFGTSTSTSQDEISPDSWPAVFRPVAAMALTREEMTTGECEHYFIKLEELLAEINATNDVAVLRSLRASLVSAAEADLGQFGFAIPWYLARMERERDDLIKALAMSHSDVLVALQETAGTEIQTVSRRAHGIYLAITQGDAVSLTSSYLWWVDDGLYSVPTVLSAPNSTWINDSVIEDELRERINLAARSLTRRGISDEVEVTGALVQSLTSRFPQMPLPQNVSANAPVDVSLSSTNSSTHEPWSGADIGIIIEIDVPERLKVKSGHLVQVKQADNRADDDARAALKWTVKRAQLDTILENDPTATYWLIQQHRDQQVLVVPAKFLIGLFSGQSARTVRYEDVRSASIPLGTEFTDLLIGLWIGSTDPQVVRTASGADSNHVPAHLIELRIASRG